MLRGMISKIRRKGGAILRRRLPSFRKSRRKFRRYRMKPEVKYVQTTFNGSSLINVTSSVSSVGSNSLFTYPSQGTSDQTRLGDTIRPVMITFKYILYAVSTVFAPMWLRVVIFTTNVDDNNLYFSTSSDRIGVNGVIDNEKITKVYYDRLHCLNVSYYNTVTSKPIGGAIGRRSVKIKLRKPIIFNAGSTTPKKDSDNFRIAIVAWSPYESTSTIMAYLQGYSRFYWTDA